MKNGLALQSYEASEEVFGEQDENSLKKASRERRAK